MNNVIVSALAAVAGSAVGALAPVFSNIMLQRYTAQRELIAKEISQKESLYAEFIKGASSLYAKAFTQALDDFQELVSLSALESRIRLSSSIEVTEAAEEVLRGIIFQFGEPNISAEDLRSMLIASARPLLRFSDICRKELMELADGILPHRPVGS